MAQDRKRQALGRGLGALIPGGGQEAPQGELLLVPVDQVFPSRNQPRRVFEPGALEELAASIREKGVLQPILVHRVPGGYELVAGERRLRASRLAGLATVPAIVRRLPEDEMLETALIENVQRENLNPLEEAAAYRDIQERFGYTQEEVAQRVGKDRVTVANALRLLSLPEEAREALGQGLITAGHGRALLSVKEPGAQRTLLDRILRKGLSVREAERAAKATKAPPKVRKEKPLEIAELERRLQRQLGSRVRIHEGSRGGRIEITYSSLDELNGIVDRVLKRNGGRS